MNLSRSAKNSLHCASNLSARSTSVINTVVFIGHAYQLQAMCYLLMRTSPNKYVGKDRQHTRSRCSLGQCRIHIRCSMRVGYVLYRALVMIATMLRGHFQTIFKKISVIMTLSPGPLPPSPLASWQMN